MNPEKEDWEGKGLKGEEYITDKKFGKAAHTGGASLQAMQGLVSCG